MTKNFFTGFYMNMKTSLLLTKPVKKLPEVLFYSRPSTNSYTMISTKNPEILGHMRAFVSNYHFKDPYLFVHQLVIFKNKRQGYGTKFLDFAKNLSKKSGCGGRVRLIATTTAYDPRNPPHLFYRKNGFSSNNKKFIAKMDRYIRKNKQLDYRTTHRLEMYYPEEPVVKKETGWSRLKDYFKQWKKALGY